MKKFYVLLFLGTLLLSGCTSISSQNSIQSSSSKQNETMNETQDLDTYKQIKEKEQSSKEIRLETNDKQDNISSDNTTNVIDIQNNSLYQGIKEEGKEIFKAMFETAVSNPEESLQVAKSTLGKVFDKTFFKNETSIQPNTIVFIGKSSCPACKEMLQKLLPETKDKFSVKYIFFNDTINDIEKYIEENNFDITMEDCITSEALMMSADKFAENLKLAVVPTLLFFDNTGRVNYVASGYFDVTKINEYTEAAFYGYGKDKIKLYDYLESEIN